MCYPQRPVPSGVPEREPPTSWYPGSIPRADGAGSDPPPAHFLLGMRMVSGRPRVGNSPFGREPGAFGCDLIARHPRNRWTTWTVGVR
jgi:hypothetical protein